MNTTLRALVNQAERLVRTEVYEEAIALCHAILRRYPRYARCYRILGQAYLGLGEHEEAANLFRRALGVDAEDPVAYAGLGVIFEERGLLEEAIWQLERAFELAPEQGELRSELARLYAERGSPASVRLTRVALARLYARGSLWNKAIGELRDLLAREPYRLDLWVTLARTLWRAGRRSEAAEVAQSILDQAPNCLVARLILGTYWCQEGREDAGRLLLQGAQELDPENAEALRLLGAQSLLPLRTARLDTGAGIGDGAPDEAEAGTAEGDGQAEPELAVGGEPASIEPGGEDYGADLPLGSLASVSGDLIAENLRATESEGLAGEPLGRQPAEEETPPEAVTLLAEEPLLDNGRRDAVLAERPLPGGPTAPPEAFNGEAPPAILSPLSVLRHRLEAEPNDHETRLALARTLVESGQVLEALPLYDALASPASGYLAQVLADLEAIVRDGNQDRALRELMGDAYARAGRFQEAMEMYRWLLTHAR